MEITERTAVVGSCTSRTEAEMQRHVLEAEGITTSITSDDAGGLHPELAFTRCATYRLVVAESQVDEARSLLASFDDTQPTTPLSTDPGDVPGDRASDASVGLERRLTLWVAALVAAVLLAGVIANLVNVFTGF